MLGSYIKIAWRSLFKNRLYAVINIMGLAIGLAIYMLSSLISDYERNHDHMFKNLDQIYTVSSVYNPSRDNGRLETLGTYLALAPIINAQSGPIKAARGVDYEVLIRTDDKKFYETPKFVDPYFFDMFNFEPLHGSVLAMKAPGQVVLTESMARKYFDRTDVVGEKLAGLGEKGDTDFEIVAVIRDLPKDNHFYTTVSDNRALGILVQFETLGKMFTFLEPDENWGWLSDDYWTYVMAPEAMSDAKVNDTIDAIYKQSAPKEEFEAVSSLNARPLAVANQAVWYSMGVPILDILDYLGLVILLIAIINYSNLATAQNMKRFREVGLRKTLGANRRQLLVQFFIECQCIVLMAMVLSLAVIEMVVPLFNTALGKVMTIDYMSMLPWLLSTTVITGLIAGGYPAYLITKASASEAIRNSGQKGRNGALIRNIMISVQFVISILMLAMVFIVYSQNNQMVKDSESFPKSEVMVLNRMGNEAIARKMELLHQRITALPDVTLASYSSQTPFVDQNWNWKVSTDKSDFSRSITTNNMLADADFTRLYNIPIVAGRGYDKTNEIDKAKLGGKRFAHVIINEKAAKQLGYDSPKDAIDQTVYVGEGNPYALYIIGVMEDRNLLGLQNRVRPFILRWRDGNYRFMSIRLKKGASADTVDSVQKIWADIYPDVPIDWNFLDRAFEERFTLMRASGSILTGFSLLALTLALFGMFGLAAFMAEQRTREIGIRKVLGATMREIIPMLLLQFSKPALWALALAIPISYYVSGLYLEMFADQISSALMLIMVAGAVTIILAWLTISVHAMKVARENPIKALRYE